MNQLASQGVKKNDWNIGCQNWSRGKIRNR